MPGDTIATLTLNPAIDKNTSVDHVVPEDKLRCQEPTREPGGGGLNVARVARRLSGEVTALYTAGGPMGDILRLLLDREELHHEAIPIESWTRENFIALDESTGLQYRFGLPGPEITREEWQDALNRIESLTPPPGYLVASGSLPPGAPDDFYARAGKIASSIGARYIVDTSGSALRHAVDHSVFLLKPNLRELRQLTGKPLEHEDEQEAAARSLIQKGKCEVIILSLGAAGALLVTEHETTHLRSPTVPIRSKVGAGDSMVGGLVTGLARGYDIRKAALYGISAGAAAVMSPGTELARAEDVERLYRQLTQNHAVPE